MLECVGLPTLSELKTNDIAISRTLLSIRWPTLQGSEDVEWLTMYAILIGTLEGRTVEYVTQSSVRSSTHISRMSKIRRYTVDSKKKCMCRKCDREVSNFRHARCHILG